MHLLEARRVKLSEGWFAGKFTGNSSEETAQLNSWALGYAEAIKDMLAVDHEDVSDE